MTRRGNKTRIGGTLGRAQGISLVELMVAMVLGLLVTAAVGHLFLTSRATYTLEEGLSRIQESGRFAMEFLTQDIRMAGYAGCNNPSNGAGTVSGNGANTVCSTNFCNMVSPANESTVFASEGVRGYAYTGNGTNNLTDWTPNLPGAFFANGNVKAGTDVVILQYAFSTNTYISNFSDAPGNANVKISANSPLAGQVLQNDVLVISDCKNTDIFRVTNSPGSGDGTNVTFTHAANGNASAHLSHDYGLDAEILRLTSRAYYIAADPNGSGEPGLMRKELAAGGVVGAGQEIVPGVEDMRLLYGLDVNGNDGIADRYVLANQVVDLAGPGTTDWDDVVSVRLGLLLRTPGNVDSQPDPTVYEIVDSVNEGPMNDAHRRHVYRTTVKLRNNCKLPSSC